MKEPHLYLQVASRIESLITNEVLKTGDKLSSVRNLSHEQGISVSTAFQAYYHLENRGLVVSRPKSGYYVKFSPSQFPKAPAISKPLAIVNDVSTDEMITRVFQDAAREDVVKLALTAPSGDLLPTAKLNKSLVHVMRTMNGSGLHYENLLGNNNLRKQIARKSLDWGGSIIDDEVIITTGCMEALIFSLRAVTKPGDTVAVESPTYFGILQAMEHIGLKVVELYTNLHTGIDLNELEAAINKFNIKACLFIPSFSNPLGSCMPDEKKKELVELVTRYKIPLIEDDVYGEIYFGKSRPRTCKSFDKEGYVLYCSSVSKTLAPGYRVGWCLPGEKYFNKIINLKITSTISTASITQAAIGHFLENGRFDHHLNKFRTAFHRQVLLYIQAIATYFPDDTLVSHPQGGFVLWVELNKKINTIDLLAKAMKINISFAPGAMFTTQKRYKNCLRISCGQPWSDKIKEALMTLGSLAKDS
ncbi:MAG: PLP-dependent aminotransferase family protein [Bacteroidota bacterium]|nr:PLP-dependent aminotransferase family protein [Bacteroidota bacterium]